MANTSRINGFKPVGHLILPTLEVQAHEYILTTSAVVYEGDVLKIVAAGTVEAAAADIGVAAIGVAAHYASDVVAGAGGVKIMVYDDPYIIFEAQTDAGTATVAADVGATCNHVAGAGSATTKQSGHQLDSSQISASGGAQFKVLGLVDVPGNAWGEYSKLRVMFNEHFYHAAVAGV